MTELFSKVLMRPPSPSFVNCVSPYREKYNVNFPRALEQYNLLKKILTEESIEVIEANEKPDFPDSVFIQDAVIIGNRSKHALLCRFGEPSRRGEESDLAELLKNQGFRISAVKEPGTLEGGDVLITDRELVLIGESPRTNLDGIRQFANSFPDTKIIRIPEQKFIHMTAAMRYLGNGKIVIGSNVIDKSYLENISKFTIIDLVEDLSPLKSNEIFRAYMLPLPSGTVLLPPGNVRTLELLLREGFRPREVDFMEYWKCNGSYMCLISPFYNNL